MPQTAATRPLSRPLVFGDPEQIAAIKALPHVVDPGQWAGLRVRFWPGYPRHEYVDDYGVCDDPVVPDIVEEIEAGRAVVIEDHTQDSGDGRLLVETRFGGMWCYPEDLEEVTCPADEIMPVPAQSRLPVAVRPAARPGLREWRVTVRFEGSKEYVVEAATRGEAIRKAQDEAETDEPDDWEIIDAEVEEL